MNFTNFKKMSSRRIIMLNRAQIIGHITHDLKKEYFNLNQEQVAKINFQVAINYGKNKEQVQFIPCVGYRLQAENICKYLHKGSKVYLEGKILVQKYTNNEGQNCISTKIMVQNVVFLDNKPVTT